MVEVHWTAYLTAFAVPVLAGVAASIAYRQWRTAQNKLKLDLFDRRMAVYQAARDALSYIATHGRIIHEEQIKYLKGIQSAQWLFGPEVQGYLNETLWHKIVDLELHNTLSARDSRNVDERAKHIHLHAETLKWLVGQYKVLDDMCAKYMTLNH